MTFIIRLTRNSADNLDFAIWKCQTMLEKKSYVAVRVEDKDGVVLWERKKV